MSDPLTLVIHGISIAGAVYLFLRMIGALIVGWVILTAREECSEQPFEPIHFPEKFGGPKR